MSQDATRRDVLTTFAAIAGLGILPTQATAQKPPANAPLVLPPMKVSVVSQSETPIEDGTETVFVFESEGSNGVRSLTKIFGRETWVGNTYHFFATTGISWWPKGANTLEPTMWQSLFTSIVDGVKGEVEGEYRTDTITATTIFGDGSFVKNGPLQTKVLANADFIKAMNFQEQANYFINRKLASMEK